jgi:hypothetical protein
VSPKPRKAAPAEIGAHFADCNGFSVYGGGCKPGVDAWAAQPRTSLFTINVVQHNVTNGRQVVLQVELPDSE